MGMSQKTCHVIFDFRALVELGPEHIAGFQAIGTLRQL
jgi:hypothetical protein